MKQVNRSVLSYFKRGLQLALSKDPGEKKHK